MRPALEWGAGLFRGQIRPVPAAGVPDLRSVLPRALATAGGAVGLLLLLADQLPLTPPLRLPQGPPEAPELALRSAAARSAPLR